jgi:hypothetical protein
MDVILDDRRHADPHMDRNRNDEQDHDDGDHWRAKDLRHGDLIAAKQSNENGDRRDGQWHVGDRCEPLMPEPDLAVPRPSTRPSGVRMCKGPGIMQSPS